jgi:hypothetical protein
MDFTQEFWHTATVAWGCGVVSLLCAIEAWRQKQLRWQLIGGVLAGLTGVLCPATLTRGYYEMVQVNQELAVLVAAKKAEGVEDEHVVRLAEEHVFESPGGIRLTRSEFSDGRRFAQLSNLFGRTGAGRAGTGRVDSENWRFDESVLGVPKKQGASGISWH